MGLEQIHSEGNHRLRSLDFDLEMSSRAVRKAVGHTAENDLAEVLRKVGLEKKSDLDEDEAISSTTNDRRRNVFQLLLDDDHSNDEKSTVDQDDENLPEDPQPSTTSKTKRKRKGKKKGTTTEKTDQVSRKHFFVGKERKNLFH